MKVPGTSELCMAVVINLFWISKMAADKKVPLLRKTSQFFLLISGLLMLLSTVVLYFYMRALLQEEADEALYSTEFRITQALKEGSEIAILPPVLEIEKGFFQQEARLRDTLMIDPLEDEMELFRELSTFKKINGIGYRITVRSMIVETEDILSGIIVSYILINLVVFGFLFYFNRRYNRILWGPFFKNLERMKQFTVSSENPLNLISSPILEFSELNKEIRHLTEKVRSDYKNLKQFTEDVSHEMQTPLAIIQAKIENCINHNTLHDEQYEQLTSIQKDIKRLSQLNKHLVLLTKLENRQFMHVAPVNLTAVLETIIQNFQELTPMAIRFEPKNEITPKMDPYLAEVLCSNLLSNAIKHNAQEGSIEVVTTKNALLVSNSGREALEHPEKLFTRFYKESKKPKSTGLGLAIAKKICDLYSFELSYSFENSRHSFRVSFGAVTS